MLRKAMIDSGWIDNAGFRWRGKDVSRLEGFSDAAFAFSLTLLVVALEVPETYDELLDVLRGFLAFAACFALLYLIWHSHYVFFRRYGLVDGPVIAWNGVLLFVVLLFTFPLKFLFTNLFGLLWLHMGWVDGPAKERMVALVQRGFGHGDPATLMVIYSSGFVVLSLSVVMLYLHAWRLRDALELDELERHLTRETITAQWVDVAVGLLSISIALIGGSRHAQYAGWAYFLIGPARAAHGIYYGRRRPARVPAASPDASNA